MWGNLLNAGIIRDNTNTVSSLLKRPFPQQIQSAHVQMEMEHHPAREANRWAHSLQVLIIMGFKTFYCWLFAWDQLSFKTSQIHPIFLLTVVSLGMSKNLCLTHRNDATENLGIWEPYDKFRLYPDVRTCLPVRQVGNWEWAQTPTPSVI